MKRKTAACLAVTTFLLSCVLYSTAFAGIAPSPWRPFNVAIRIGSQPTLSWTFHDPSAPLTSILAPTPAA